MIQREGTKGFSLIEVLVAAALLAIVLGGVASISKIMGKQQTQSNATFQVSQVRNVYVGLMQNTSTASPWWQNTLADPKNAATFKCLNTATSCAGQGGTAINPATKLPFGEFLARDSGGGLVVGYDPTIATSGFTLSGQACSSYKATGNDNCPLRLDLVWIPACPPGGGCINPPFYIKGLWTYSPSTHSRIAFNSANYDFTQLFSSVVAPPPPGVHSCPANQVMTGVDFGAQKVYCANFQPSFGGAYFQRLACGAAGCPIPGSLFCDVSNPMGNPAINGGCNCPAGYSAILVFHYDTVLSAPPPNSPQLGTYVGEQSSDFYPLPAPNPPNTFGPPPFFPPATLWSGSHLHFLPIPYLRGGIGAFAAPNVTITAQGLVCLSPPSNPPLPQYPQNPSVGASSPY